MSEVFLTGAERLSSTQFLCFAQLPRAHRYFNDHTHAVGYYDMLLILEVFRQVSIYVSHTFLDVDIHDKFIYMDSDTRLLQRSPLLVGNRNAEVVIKTTVVDEYLRNGIRAGVTLDMTLYVEKQEAMHKRMGIRWMSNAVWSRMREKGMSLTPTSFDPLIQRPAPVAPSLVGRTHPGNVVIGQTIQEIGNELLVPVVVDQQNPGLFDHPLDHIPGMLLLEVIRQTGLIAANRYQGIAPDELLLSRCQIRFTRFGEFGLATSCRVTSDTVCLADDQETLLMSMLIEQEGITIATANIELSSLTSDHTVLLTCDGSQLEEA